MLIAKRNNLGGAILPYDKEVEYLEASGTQWINSGIPWGKKGDNFDIQFEIAFTNTSGRKLMLANGYGYFGCNAGRFEFSGNYYGTINPNTWYKIRFSKNSMETSRFYIDGVLKYSLAQTVWFDGYYYLWTILSNGLPSASFAMSARIRNFKIESNNGNVDFIPVRKDGIGYMYDRVSGELVGNEGMGAFIIGPDKS